MEQTSVKTPPPPPDTDDSNNEHAGNEFPQQQLATSAVSNLHKRHRGRPKRCKLAEDHDGISTTSLVESNNQSESLSTASDQSSQSDLKLRPKTSTGNLKDQIIGAPVDRFNTSNSPVKKLALFAQ